MNVSALSSAVPYLHRSSLPFQARPGQRIDRSHKYYPIYDIIRQLSGRPYVPAGYLREVLLASPTFDDAILADTGAKSLLNGIKRPADFSSELISTPLNPDDLVASIKFYFEARGITDIAFLELIDSESERTLLAVTRPDYRNVVANLSA